MADAVGELLAADGLFIFEVSYLLDIVHKMLFDTVYHEHLCYHSVRSLAAFFSATRTATRSMCSASPPRAGRFAARCNWRVERRPVSPEVRRLIEWEELTRLQSPETFRALGVSDRRREAQFVAVLDRCRAAGKVVAGYGASPTVTTLLNQFDLGRRLDFLVDDNPVKQHTFVPGRQIPVYPPEAIYERDVDVIAVLAWNYAAPIVAKHRRFVEYGGRFVVPLPQLQVI